MIPGSFDVFADCFWLSLSRNKVNIMFLTFRPPGLTENSRTVLTPSNYDQNRTFSRGTAAVVRSRAVVDVVENDVSLEAAHARGEDEMLRDTNVRIVDCPTLAAALGLSRSREERDQFVASIPILDLQPLPPEQLYPPDDSWISESALATREWEAKLTTATLRDPRARRRPLVQIDGSGYRRIVRREESAIIRDAKSEQVVLVVIRDFIRVPQVLERINELVAIFGNARKDERVSHHMPLANIC